MDATTIAIGVGLLVSLAISEVFGITAGGMIVPGYFALSVDRPLDLVVTMLVAAATFGVIRFLSQHLIIYGRRRIVFALLFGFLVGAAAKFLLQGSIVEEVTGCCVIGFIIPGLIALWFDRQGLRETLGSLATSTVLVRLVLITIGMEIVQ